MISAACLVKAQPGDTADAFVRLPVPDGALLKQFKFWAYDASDAVDLNFRVYEQCQAEAGRREIHARRRDVHDSRDGPSISVSRRSNDFPVDNKKCGYTVRVQFAEPGQDCAGTSAQVQKMQVSWIRRVSPAPATATFGDVPTTSGQFKFVEALVSSGITAGCGGGNYCPDDPVTRGQMAVFLRKRFGLYFP